MLMKTFLLGMVLLTTGVVSGLLHPRLAAAQLAADSYTNTMLPGLNLIANQLDALPDNTLNSVLPNVPEGSAVYKWNPTTAAFTTYSFEDGLWDNGTVTFGPHEAVFLYNPGTTYDLVFTGKPRDPVPPPPSLLRNRLYYLSGPSKHPA